MLWTQSGRGDVPLSLCFLCFLRDLWRFLRCFSFLRLFDLRPLSRLFSLSLLRRLFFLLFLRRLSSSSESVEDSDADDPEDVLSAGLSL